MLVRTTLLSKKAQKQDYAIGAFNTSNLEITQGIVRGAINARAPVIIMVTETSIRYAGLKTITSIIKGVVEEEAKDIPFALHLDHGRSYQIIERAIEAGFNSVMIDASNLPFRENLTLTKKVVNYAHRHKVDVQAELGIVPHLGEEPLSVDWEEIMTDPGEAEEFVKKTKIDTLAVAIGNAHGFFRERPRLDWQRLEDIQRRVKIPLILHGASDFSSKNIKKAIRGGVACFNIDTDLRVAFSSALRTKLLENHSIYDPRSILKPAIEAVEKVVEKKIKILGSNDKA